MKKHFIKGFALLALVVMVSSTASAGGRRGGKRGGGGNSNDAGIISLDVTGSATLGGSTITRTNGSQSSTENGVGANSAYGITAQYGLLENISAGIYVRSEGAAYVTTSSDDFSSSSIVTSGFGTGLEGRFYAVNKEKFNLYFGPAIGFSSSKATDNSSSSSSISLSGLNYSILAGIHYYFVDFMGMNASLGYNGSSLKGTADNGTNLKIANGGFFIGAGLSFKFGGK